MVFMQGVNWTSRPHPNWKPGDKQPNPWNSTNFETLDPNELGAAAYPLVRRALSWRSTVGDGMQKHIQPVFHSKPSAVADPAIRPSRSQLSGAGHQRNHAAAHRIHFQPG